MRLAIAVISCAIAALLVPFALDWRAPYTANVRPWVLAFLIVAALVFMIAGIVTARRRQARPVALRLLGACAAALAAFALIATLASETRFRSARQQVLDADLNALERLGRHFIVGYRDLDDILALIERRAVAGVYVSANNVQGLSAAEIKQQIGAMQDLRRAQHLPPLWIATDQEGGGVSRLSPPLSRLPSLAALVAAHPDRAERLDAVREFALLQGHELSDLGVNLNFAPVIDVNHGIVNPADRYTRIHQRAISGDPDMVAEVAGAYCAGLAETGVRCTLKHFPGLGRVFDDTHSGSADLNAPLGELDKSDWVPFRALLGHANAFTMLAHARLTALDRDHPVSTSAPVIAGALRGAWRHDGVLITDDFSMGAIYRGRAGVGGAAVAAINAGADLILISFDPDQYYAAMRALLDAEAQGQLRRDVLQDSERRLAGAAPSDPLGPHIFRPADVSN